jgi:hypothetical protein
MSSKIFSHLKNLKNINLVDNDCVSMEIPNPNSNILLTEDILIPCSCQVFGNGKNPYHLDVLFILVGLLVAIISAILAMMILRLKYFQAVELCMGLKNGECFDRVVS